MKSPEKIRTAKKVLPSIKINERHLNANLDHQQFFIPLELVRLPQRKHSTSSILLNLTVWKRKERKCKADGYLKWDRIWI